MRSDTFDMSSNRKSISKSSKKYAPAKKFRSYKSNPRYMLLHDPKVLTNRPEKKHIDTTSSLTCPIGSAFVVTPAHLTAISQGAGSQARLGSKSRICSVHLRTNALWNGGQTTSSPGQIRTVLVWDRQPNGASCTRTDVFQDGTLWYSPILMGSTERFVVIADEISEQCSNGQFNVTQNIFRKFDLESTWSGTATVPTTGALFLFVAACSDINNATTALFPSVQFYSRVRFSDA